MSEAIVAEVPPTILPIAFEKNDDGTTEIWSSKFSVLYAETDTILDIHAISVDKSLSDIEKAASLNAILRCVHAHAAANNLTVIASQVSENEIAIFDSNGYEGFEDLHNPGLFLFVRFVPDQD